MRVFARVALAAFLAVLTAAAGAAEPVRVGVLKFGTVNWELDTILHHGFDRRHGIELEMVEFANNEATKVALQGGAVDMIVTDWPWVSRQRAEGADFTFVPYSLAVGALMVPPDSDIDGVGDLAGRRIGIAGGPLDKSWLLLRALAAKEYGLELTTDASPSFGAPPLMNEELISGRLDGVLTYWHYAARLKAQGYREALGVADIVRQLGVETDAPLLGYAFSEGWAGEHRDAVAAFVAASQDAKTLLAESDDEWRRLRALTRAEDDATLAALRDGYRAGIPTRWGEAERADAVTLFAILAEVGGEELVGASPELQPGTFWNGVMF